MTLVFSQTDGLGLGEEAELEAQKPILLLKFN
jgi:hypothetical protein